MIKDNVEVIHDKGLVFLSEKGEKIKYKPWLSDLFSFLYDKIMEKSIFPKKFGGSLALHNDFLLSQYRTLENKKVLELACGSGSLSCVLPTSNQYAGLDISQGLLKIARKKFIKKGFSRYDFFLSGVESLLFQDDYFDYAMCHLSLNFFDKLENVILEIKRTLKPRGVFSCSVPVPERNREESVIRGKLYSEKELKDMFEKNGFDFVPLDYENGAVFYFKALLQG